jgi:ATP-binding cassette, subfamily F, member 3
VRDGTVRGYDGDIEHYRAECLAERRGLDRGKISAPAGGRARPSPQRSRRRAAEQRAALAPLKQAVARAEAEVEALNREIAKLERALADPDIYQGDAARAQVLARERGKRVEARGAAELAWLVASEAYEAALAEARQGVS